MAESSTAAAEQIPNLRAKAEGGMVTTWIDDSRSLLRPYNAEFESAIGEVSKTRDCSILAVYSAKVRMLHPGVLGTWLDNAKRPDFKMRRAVVVSPYLAIRSAANAFGKATGILGLKFDIRAFATEEEGRAWLKEQGAF